MGKSTQEARREFKNENGIISVSSGPNIPKVKGLGVTLFENMLENGDQLAQIDGLTGEKETWKQLLQKSVRTAIAMRSKGITSDHVVSVCSFNHLNAFVPVIASSFLNVKTANLDPTISLPDTIALLEQIRPKLIFVGLEATKLIEEALKEANIDADIVVFGNSKTHLNFSEFLQPSPEVEEFVPAEIQNVHETAVIFFSSGTTGLPKGICLSHYGLLAPKLSDTVNKEFDKIILSFSSSYWVSSMAMLLISALWGVIRLVYPKFEVDKTWSLIKDYKVNCIFTAPSQIISMCKKGRPKDADTSSLQLVMLGGGPVSNDQMLEVRQAFNASLVQNIYATTELSGNGLTWLTETEDLLMLLEKPESVGRPANGCLYKIVDPDTEQILGPGQKGELRIKTNFHMNGYYNRDSSVAWDADGFFKTGDIAYYDDDYCFYIVDRIKEMLKYQSWHVVPAKLEAILLNHPAVEAAVVFGIPHPEDGDHPMALVVLKEAVNTSEEELEKYVEERVDERQRLRAGVKIVRSIPVNPNGKYNRRAIRDLVLRNEL